MPTRLLFNQGDAPMSTPTAAAMRAFWLGLPVADPAAVTGERFAVIAPHPDDESLACGGIIAEACRRGRPPVVIVLTDGSRSHLGSRRWPASRLAAVRAAEAREAVAALGLPEERLHLLGVPDGRAPHDATGVEGVAARLRGLVAECETVLTTWRHDPHGDHGAAWKIARAAAPAGARVLEYPVWGWMLPDEAWLPTEAWQGWRVDVSAHLPAKRRAIAAHASQLGRVIDDDPDGFVMPPAFLARFDTRWEVLVTAP